MCDKRLTCEVHTSWVNSEKPWHCHSYTWKRGQSPDGSDQSRYHLYASIHADFPSFSITSCHHNQHCCENTGKKTYAYSMARDDPFEIPSGYRFSVALHGSDMIVSLDSCLKGEHLLFVDPKTPHKSLVDPHPRV